MASPAPVAAALEALANVRETLAKKHNAITSMSERERLVIHSQLVNILGQANLEEHVTCQNMWLKHKCRYMMKSGICVVQ